MSEGFSNILTVDVEDWFHILDLDGAPDRKDWSGLESRVVSNTDRLLEVFAEVGASATFFFVGWVAEQHPDLVRRVAAAGHEVGSHSYWHEILHRHHRESLAADLGRSKKVLEDLSGTAVRGFRAPGASITEETAWAFDVIAEQGFAYDSSLCPGFSSHGGFPSPYTTPHQIRCDAGKIVEIPSATTELLGRRFVYSGGGYLRLFPYRFIRAAIARENRAGWPTNIYVHPREIDPDQPRMPMPAKRRFKYYVGVATTEGKLRSLVRDHRFVSAAEWIAGNADRLEGRILDLRAQIAAAPPCPDASRVPPPPPDPLPAL